MYYQIEQIICYFYHLLDIFMSVSVGEYGIKNMQFVRSRESIKLVRLFQRRVITVSGSYILLIRHLRVVIQE